jgi:hypothetical protein
VKAHRAFYEAFEGPLPDGKYLQHHLPPRIDASVMPAAIQTICNLTICQGAGIQVEPTTALRRTSLGPLSTLSEEPHQESYVVADVPGNRRGSTKTTAFQRSILGGADQADRFLSFVVPLLELILRDFAPTEDRFRSEFMNEVASVSVFHPASPQDQGNLHRANGHI